MKWVDVFSPPGVDKSAVLESLWPEYAFRYGSTQTLSQEELDSFLREGRFDHPEEWSDFIVHLYKVFQKLGFTHQNISVKLAAMQALDTATYVVKYTADQIYIQAGLADAGAAFIPKLLNSDVLIKYYQLLPVSIGVVLLSVPEDSMVDVIREQYPEASTKELGQMVDRWATVLKRIVCVLEDRNVNLLVLDAEDDPFFNQQRILSFAGCELKSASDVARYCHYSSPLPGLIAR